VSLTITHTPTEYDATFEMLVTACATDFLQDAPVTVLVMPDPDGEIGTTPIEGVLVAIGDAALVVHAAGDPHPYVLPIADIEEISFD